jgi:hypothetical protein
MWPRGRACPSRPPVGGGQGEGFRRARSAPFFLRSSNKPPHTQGHVTGQAPWHPLDVRPSSRAATRGRPLGRWWALSAAQWALRWHDVAQPLSDRSIRKSPSFLQTLFAAQSHGVLSVASASVRDCGRACVSRRCAFARGASRGSSPQVRASTRIIHRRGAPALSQALSRRRRRDGQPERASFDRDR